MKDFLAACSFFFITSMHPYSALAATQREVLVERVEIEGARRFPRETTLYYIQTRSGDPYNPAQLERDLRSLWAQNMFSNIEVLVRDDERGGKVVIFRVEENPIIRDLQFIGLKSATESDVLTQFRERRVGVAKEELWDPAKAGMAKRVLKELLASKGHPEAKVDFEVERISAAAVGVTFQIEEGSRVRVLTIDFEGNQHFSDAELRGAMKNVKEAGLITRFTSRDIYRPEALKDDLERVRFFVLNDKGYLEAQVGEPDVKWIEREKECLLLPFRIPLVCPPNEGLHITIPLHEGRQFRFGEIKLEGNTVFSDEQIKRLMGIKSGDIVSSTVIQKGISETLSSLYGQLGYIEMVAHPSHTLRDDPNNPTQGIANFVITIEEGRQFTLNRLEFPGNTITRDKVIRREVLTQEGDVFNQLLWKQSLLRLNQLGFFGPIKEEDAAFKPDERTGLLDIDLRVKEKGRNTINFNGGLGGSAGSFVGLSYSTNNLLGYGEALSFDIAAGNRQQSFAFTFTEPYLLDRNVSLGFGISALNFDFFNAGFGFTAPVESFSLAPVNDLLFKQKSVGFNIFSTTPLATLTKRWPTFGRWTRVGLTYSYNATTIEDPPVNRDHDPRNDIAVPFRQSDIRTSTIASSLFYNTLNHPVDPTDGQSLSVSLGLSGKFLGGDVNLFQPAVEFKHFQTMPLSIGGKPTVLGFRLLFGHLSPFGERFRTNSLSFVGGTPIYNRFFLGGQDSIRGYLARSISPVAVLEQRLTTTQVQAVISSSIGSLSAGEVLPVVKNGDPPLATPFVREEVIQAFTFQDQFPVRRTIPIGGDTNLLFNMEYRIPIAGPFSVALFGDIGSAFNLRRYDNQVIISNPVRQSINPFFFPPNGTSEVVFGPGGGIILNPDGQLATREEIEFARAAQGMSGDALPNGFTNVSLVGLNQTASTVSLSETKSGLSALLGNYRASVGIELRFQVPVVNLPIRLIYAYNPNAKVKPEFPGMLPEERTKFRFGIGRTF